MHGLTVRGKISLALVGIALLTSVFLTAALYRRGMNDALDRARRDAGRSNGSRTAHVNRLEPVPS